MVINYCFISFWPAPPAAPGTPSVMISNSRQEFIVKWDEPPLSMGETVDTYFVNISGPSALCGSTDTLQKVNARNYTCFIKTEPQEDETVIIRVQAANCGGNLIGPESEAVSVSFQGMLNCKLHTCSTVLWWNGIFAKTKIIHI